MLFLYFTRFLRRTDIIVVQYSNANYLKSMWCITQSMHSDVFIAWAPIINSCSRVSLASVPSLHLCSLRLLLMPECIGSSCQSISWQHPQIFILRWNGFTAPSLSPVSVLGVVLRSSDPAWHSSLESWRYLHLLASWKKYLAFLSAVLVSSKPL